MLNINWVVFVWGIRGVKGNVDAGIGKIKDAAELLVVQKRRQSAESFEVVAHFANNARDKKKKAEKKTAKDGCPISKGQTSLSD